MRKKGKGSSGENIDCNAVTWLLQGSRILQGRKPCKRGGRRQSEWTGEKSERGKKVKGEQRGKGRSGENIDRNAMTRQLQGSRIQIIIY